MPAYEGNSVNLVLYEGLYEGDSVNLVLYEGLYEGDSVNLVLHEGLYEGHSVNLVLLCIRLNCPNCLLMYKTKLTKFVW